MSWWQPSSWFLSADEVQRGKDADARLDALNRQAWESGKIDSQEYQRRQAAAAGESASTYESQVDAAFEEGWQQGKDSVSDAVAATTRAVTGAAGSVVSAPLRGLLSGIPWWLWLAAAGVVVWKLGLAPGLVSSARRVLR